MKPLLRRTPSQGDERLCEKNKVPAFYKTTTTTQNGSCVDWESYVRIAQVTHNVLVSSQADALQH